MERIKLVVVNENMLGYITPELPEYVGIFRSSILRGATYPETSGPYMLRSFDKTRLASEKDFNDFRVVMNGFNNLPEVYEFATN